MTPDHEPTPDHQPKVSVVIPYKQRLDNLRLAFESLAAQTLGRDGFEVVVGVMEYSEGYLSLCREFSGRLSVVSVLSDRPWQVGLARNLALRQATGEVLVLLDADMVLPPSALATLYERYFASGRDVCVAGQMIDYDNNTSDVHEIAVRPFAHYRRLLAELEAADDVRADARLHTPHVVPWAFAWTALVAVRRELVVRHDLMFDLNFHGYGVEDLEWAYRISATGTPIIMGADLYGIHLPHPRSVEQNRRTELVNYRYFLSKWPAPDVELACAFGDFEANSLFLDLTRELRAAVGPAGGAGASPAVVRGEVSGASTLVIGAVLDGGGRLDAGVAALFDPGTAPQVLPLVGLALPWPDDSVGACLILPPVGRLGPRYRDAVLAEARRVTLGDVRFSNREADRDGARV